MRTPARQAQRTTTRSVASRARWVLSAACRVLWGACQVPPLPLCASMLKVRSQGSLCLDKAVLAQGGGGGRGALEGKGPRRWPQKPLDRRLEVVAEAVGGGYYRLQMPLRLALAARETVAGHRLGALERGGGVPPPFQCIPGGGGGGCPVMSDACRLHLREAPSTRLASQRGHSTPTASVVAMAVPEPTHHSKHPMQSCGLLWKRQRGRDFARGQFPGGSVTRALTRVTRVYSRDTQKCMRPTPKSGLRRTLLRGRFRTARAQRQLLRCLPREHPCKPPPYRSVHDPFKTASGLQTSGPWDPWLPCRLFAQRTVRPLNMAANHVFMFECPAAGLHKQCWAFSPYSLRTQLPSPPPCNLPTNVVTVPPPHGHELTVPPPWGGGEDCTTKLYHSITV